MRYFFASTKTYTMPSSRVCNNGLIKKCYVSETFNGLTFLRRLFVRQNDYSIDLKVHKIENFFDSDFGICVISLLVMHK
jgi:hypothetical protein